MKKLIQVLALLFLAGNVTFSQDIECFVLTPPEIILENVTKISILDFSGKKGKELSEFMVSELFKENRGIKMTGEGFFNLPKREKPIRKEGVPIFLRSSNEASSKKYSMNKT